MIRHQRRASAFAVDVDDGGTEEQPLEEDEDKEEGDYIPLFPGSDYDEKYLSYQDLDENQEEVFIKTIDRLSTIATIWYMSGTQDQEEFDAVLALSLIHI